MRTALIAMSLAVTQRAGAQWPAAMTPTEAAEVAQGRVVVLQRDVEGAPWPRMRLFRSIDATPEQSVAMLADYEHQRDYNVDLKEARIARRLDAGRTEVFFKYASNFPFISDVSYTVLEQVERGADGSYRIGWSLLQGTKLKSIQGSARFSPWTNPATGRSGTLLTYDSFVVPAFRFASLGAVRAKAVENMRAAVDAIAIEVERERSRDHARLEGQVTALRAALAH